MSHDQPQDNFKKVNITESCLELAEMMSQMPSMADKELIKKGEALIAIFQDSNFSDKFQDLAQIKQQLLLMAANDIASGVMTLRSSIMGVAFLHSKLKTYITPHGSLPEGSVVFSLSWKNIRAFGNWRKGEEIDLAQEDVNSSIYYLSYLISKLIMK